MPDYNKIIAGLLRCTDHTSINPCRHCPYRIQGSDGDDLACTEKLMNDALEFMQSEYTPHGTWIPEDNRTNEWRCSECGHGFINGFGAQRLIKYCSECGAKMDIESGESR